jgi:7-carboxy-7-deazaguanine synthase
MNISEIIHIVDSYKAKYITLTGGEPLAQKNAIQLLEALAKKDYSISLETGGFIDIVDVPHSVRTILDIKTPGSSVSQHNDLNNLTKLKKGDEIKFVICDKNDFDWSVKFLKEHNLLSNFAVWFSPSYQELKLSDLADWILKSGLPIAMQTQLHKEIWGNKEGV